MKFPRPRKLEENGFPDLIEDQPTLLQNLVQKCIKPPENSSYDQFLDSTISFVKQKAKESLRNAKLFNTIVGKKLYFVMASFPASAELIPCLIDTGASNSLLHQSVIAKLNLPIQPTSMKMSTATGTSNDIITGTSHLTFQLIDHNGHEKRFCTNFIVTKKLNGMQCILGAEFLLDQTKVISISAAGIIVQKDDIKSLIPMIADKEGTKLNNTFIKNNPENNSVDTAPMETNSKSTDTDNPDLMDSIDLEKCEDISHVYVHLTTLEYRSGLESVECRPPHKEPSAAVLYNHNISDDLEDETLPPSEQFFDENMELKFESLEKTISLEDADYSECPPEFLPQLKNMLSAYEDRFSKSKLDLQTTELYEASLPTLPGRIVQQKVRRLPEHKFQFALQAIRQLQQSGVVRESDSEWRSNVVLVPKPTGKDELRETTNAAKLTGEQNFSQLYRICLDFRELNTCLEFPQQTSFTTADEILYKLKNKVVISMDISSAFFIIPIKEEDRYKTAFWVNNLAFEFNVAVMGLKSSPYHLNKFMERAFNQETFDKIKGQLPENEQKQLPNSFLDILISYFDDMFVYAETY